MGKVMDMVGGISRRLDALEKQQRNSRIEAGEKEEEPSNLGLCAVVSGAESKTNDKEYHLTETREETIMETIKVEHGEVECCPPDAGRCSVLESNDSFGTERWKSVREDINRVCEKEEDKSNEELVQEKAVENKEEDVEEGVNEEECVISYLCGKVRKSKDELQQNINDKHLSLFVNDQKGGNEGLDDERIHRFKGEGKCVTSHYSSTQQEGKGHEEPEIANDIKKEGVGEKLDEGEQETSHYFGESRILKHDLQEYVNDEHLPLFVTDQKAGDGGLDGNNRQNSIFCLTGFRSHQLEHLRTLADEEPYKCNFCEYRSSRKQHLCSYGCCRKDELREHIVLNVPRGPRDVRKGRM